MELVDGLRAGSNEISGILKGKLDVLPNIGLTPCLKCVHRPAFEGRGEIMKFCFSAMSK